MSKLSKTLAALPFAHLLGVAPRAENSDDGDDDSAQRADESDEDYAKRMEDEEKDGDDDKRDNETKKGKKAKKAKNARSEENDDGDDDDEGDEDDDDGGGSDKEKAARKSERARCAAIFKCDAAGTRPDVAAHLAFSTDMSSAQAISMLNTVAAGGAPRGVSLSSRMSGVRTPKVGADDQPAPAANTPQGVAAFVAAAVKKANGQ